MARGPPLADLGYDAGDRGCVSVLLAQGRLPAPVPPPGRVPAAPLPPRRRRGLPAWTWARPLLSRLLLGADARDVRGRRGQPLVDGRLDRADGVREDGAGRAPRRSTRGGRVPAARGTHLRASRLGAEPAGARELTVRG